MVDLALTDIVPKENNVRDKEAIQRFSNLMRHRTFTFYVKNFEKGHNFGWRLLNKTWSVDDWLIKWNLAKLKPNTSELFLNFDEIVEDSDNEREVDDNDINRDMNDDALFENDPFPPHRPLGA